MGKLLTALLVIGAVLMGCETEEIGEDGGNGGTLTNVDLFHGYYDVGPGYHFRLKFRARKGDTLYFEARVRDGDGNINYAFWADSVNYVKWLNDDSTFSLRGYTEEVQRISYTPALDSAVYYVVLGNSSSITTKRFWIRAYLRGLR